MKGIIHFKHQKAKSIHIRILYKNYRIPVAGVPSQISENISIDPLRVYDFHSSLNLEEESEYITL
jgi:hypothetical protein